MSDRRSPSPSATTCPAAPAAATLAWQALAWPRPSLTARDSTKERSSRSKACLRSKAKAGQRQQPVKGLPPMSMHGAVGTPSPTTMGQRPPPTTSSYHCQASSPAAEQRQIVMYHRPLRAVLLSSVIHRILMVPVMSTCDVSSHAGPNQLTRLCTHTAIGLACLHLWASQCASSHSDRR